MSLQKSATPLVIELHPSKLALAALAFLHFGAISLVVILNLALPHKTVLCSLIIMSLLICLINMDWVKSENHLIKRWQNNGIRRICWRADQQNWWLITRGNKKLAARLLPSSYCHPMLVVLNFVVDDIAWFKKRKSAIIPFDATDSDHFKQLRVHLGLNPVLKRQNLAE